MNIHNAICNRGAGRRAISQILRRSTTAAMIMVTCGLGSGCGALDDSGVDENGAGEVLDQQHDRQLEQQVAALTNNDLALGDFNKDGVANTLDGIAYIKSFGIKLNTYGVTDDVYNTGVGLPRRTYDWQVFDISEFCLQAKYNLNPEAFPADKLPRISTMVQNFLRMPPQYLRELGRRGYTISFFEAIGRLAKRWGGLANGSPLQLAFFHVSNGYAGKLRVPSSPGVWADWEDLSNITFNPNTGALSFTRPIYGQTFTGTVGTDTSDGVSTGSTLSGTFRNSGDPNTYTWAMNSQYPYGGTTFAAGDGPRSACTPASQTVGHTSPLIQLNLSAAVLPDARGAGFNAVHEVGHVIAYMIRENALSFTPVDANAFATAFPGPTQCVGDQTCGVPGSGYVDFYAARGDEDMAETWAYYIMDPADLDARIQQDIMVNGNQALANKKAFIKNRVDSPDQAPFGVADGSFPSYTFATRANLMYTTAGVSPTGLPGGGQSHLSMGGFVDNTNLMWLFAVGTDNGVYYQNVNSANQFSGFQRFGGHLTRLPVATAWFPDRGEGVVIMVGTDDAIYYRMVSNQGALGATALIPGLSTLRAVAAAPLRGLMYVFAASPSNRIMYATISPTLGLSGWTEVPGGARARDGVGAGLTIAKDAITLGILDSNFQIRLSHVRPSVFGGVTFDTSWTAETTRATVGTVPAISGNTLNVKGFGDGGIYTKSLTSTGGYSLISGL